jgi:SSS family solute:Na+ symporter
MFPALASYLLPTGLVGLTLAGLIAALMSSIDSEICAASGLFAMDWYQPLRPQASQRRLVWAGRIMGFVIMLVGIVWAIVVIPQFRFLYEYLAKFASYLPGTIVACFLWGLLSKYPTRRAAFATLITGSLLGISMWLINDSETINRLVCQDEGLGWSFLEMHFLHAAFALFTTASLLLFGLSSLLPDEEGAKSLAEQEKRDDNLSPTRPTSRAWACRA